MSNRINSQNTLMEIKTFFLSSLINPTRPRLLNSSVVLEMAGVFVAFYLPFSVFNSIEDKLVGYPSDLLDLNFHGLTIFEPDGLLHASRNTTSNSQLGRVVV